MNLYGIKIVPPDWSDAMPLPFDKSGYDTAKPEQGTRVLLFRAGEGLIGEAEIDGYVVRPAEWATPSTAHLPPSLAKADYLQPVRVLYMRADVITPEQVRKVLNNPTFPEAGDSWLTIDHNAYQQFANWTY